MACDAVLVLAAVAVVLLTWLAMYMLVWRPYAVQKAFRQQGIGGPAYRFWVGSNEESEAMHAATADDVLDHRSHDILPRAMPHYQAWTASYGKVFLSWMGFMPVLCISDYDMVKHILSNKAGVFNKALPGPKLLALLGRGLIFADGADWLRHRRVVHPAFTMDKLKMMAPTMAECAEEVVGSWEADAAASGGVLRVEDVGKHFADLTADVISRTAFGGEGKEVFPVQEELQRLAFAGINIVPLPGLEYLPTKDNMRLWKLAKRLRGMLMAIIRGRGASGGGYGGDLLGLMLEANVSAGLLSSDDIIDECKTFFIAGHDTTSHLLSWAVFLLGTHPEWQHKLRQEVLQECGGAGTLHGDVLSRLKQMTMVLYEALRLYGPISLVARRATADTEVGGVKIPKGTIIMIPIAMMHRDEQMWGADAGEFKPERFRDGVGRAAKHPSAMLAFSLGPRSCIGQDFAMLEAKATLALILRRFEFTVAPDYVHAPAQFLALRPKYGIPILLNLLQ
ncbi:unnamed protein product [Alopecurus aequalis]